MKVFLLSILMLGFYWPNYCEDFYYDLVPEASPPGSQDPIDLKSKSKQEVRDLLRFIYFSRVTYLTGVEDQYIQNEFPGAFVEETKATKARFFMYKDNDRKRIIIAVRGSNNLRNWLSNLEIQMRHNNWFDHKIHSGFLTIAQEIYSLIKQDIDPSYEIALTGHSMGGAVSAIIAAYLHKEGYKVEAITFAQPRVTDNDGAAKMQEVNLNRIVIDGDVVNMLPPFNYAHFGKQTLLNVDRYYPEDYQADFSVNKENELHLTLFRFEFGAKKSEYSSKKPRPMTTGSLAFYNSYVEGGKIEAVHNLVAYFRAMRARISDILGGISEPLNSKLESLQFPEISNSFPIFPSR